MPDDRSDLAARRRRHDALASALRSASDLELLDLLDTSPTKPGWGTSQTIAMLGSSVFAKRLPVTDIEAVDIVSTRNLYGLPPHLNYPFGSPGLGVGRELAMALSATEWVASGACPHFPMLFHYRMVSVESGASSRRGARGGEQVARADDPDLRRYLGDRAVATHELLLFFEHAVDSAVELLIDRPHEVGWIVEQSRAAIAFLRGQGVIHFDTDFSNIVVDDGGTVYLSDFGLALHDRFDLDADERAFHSRNRHFDDGNLLLGAAHQLFWNRRALPAEAKTALDRHAGIEPGMGFEAALVLLLDDIEWLDASGTLPLGADYVRLLQQHDAPIRLMHSFFTEMRANWTSAIVFDDDALVRALDASGFSSRS